MGIIDHGQAEVGLPGLPGNLLSQLLALRAGGQVQSRLLFWGGAISLSR